VHAAVSSSPVPLVVGRYRVTRTLGRGSNAAVYRASSLDDGNEVALKLFHDGVVSASPLRVARESTIACAVDHPNVVRTLEVGRWHGRPWLAMELLDGPTLGDWMHGLGRAVLLREVVRIGRDVVAGLDSLHRCGIVHRDLGVGNVVLADHRAHLIDLGSARRMGSRFEGGLDGSPACLAPERIVGSPPCSPAEDMWSLGILIYRMIAGVHPFAAQRGTAMMERALREHPPSVREYRQNVPTALSLLTLKLLAKDPANRPAIHEARQVLSRWDV